MKTIPLTQGLVAIVDDADYERLAAHKRCAMRCRRSVYAVRTEILPNGGRRHRKMHRDVLGLTASNPPVDHVNGYGLDNRRGNLRICTVATNGMNRRVTAGKDFKGIRMERGRWRARIKVGGRLLHLGLFRDQREAAAAYDRAAAEHFGEFARPNLVGTCR